MTRKDYLLIASRIKPQLGSDPTFVVRETLEDLALGLAEDFKTDNPNFQPERFLAACGVTL
jgi:hypothetical protein